ncbi:hypothetical protein ACF1BQ_045880 [Bradyrhizobium sp. RDT10]
MTVEYGVAISRRIPPEVSIFVWPSLKTEGAGMTGCLLHPRSRVRFAQAKVHTSIQGSGSIPAFLRNGLTAYFELSLVNGFLATIAAQGMNPMQLVASTAASGPHDFAVRFSQPRQSWLPRPSHLTARS